MSMVLAAGSRRL